MWKEEQVDARRFGTMGQLYAATARSSYGERNFFEKITAYSYLELSRAIAPGE